MIKESYSLDEVSELCGVNVWTIRFWADRFDIIRPRRDKKGNLRFAPDDVERFRMICHLTKTKGIKRTDVQQYLLESADALK